MNIARDVLENGTYHDTHCWVFTPRSFGSLFERLASGSIYAKRPLTLD
jgi:hypothetical protein